MNSITEMVNSSPALLASTLIYSDNFTLTKGGILNIKYDLDDKDYIKLKKADLIKLIQFGSNELSTKTLTMLNDLVSDKSTRIRITLNGYGAFKDLDFLKILSNISHLTVDLTYIIDVQVLSMLNRLISISVSRKTFIFNTNEKKEDFHNFCTNKKIKPNSLRFYNQLKFHFIFKPKIKRLIINFVSKLLKI